MIIVTHCPAHSLTIFSTNYDEFLAEQHFDFEHGLNTDNTRKKKKTDNYRIRTCAGGAHQFIPLAGIESEIIQD